MSSAVLTTARVGTDRLNGPMYVLPTFKIVREQTATTYVDRGFRAAVHRSGALMLGRGGDA